MRTAIKTYQTAGEVEYDDQGRPFMRPPVTPEVTQERPQQPSPGAAGQATPATPPPPTPTPTPAPPAAITTGPTLVRTVPEEPMTDPDEHRNIWLKREQIRFEDPETAKVISHRGDHRPLEDDVSPDQYGVQFHPEYPNYREGLELVDKYTRTNPKLAASMNKQLDAMRRRMSQDQMLKYRAQHEKVKSAAANELRAGFDARPLPPAQEEKLDESIKTSLSNYDATMFGPKNPAIVTPQDRHEANEQKAVSPMMTLPIDKQNAIIRNLIYFNRDAISTEDAVRIMMKLGSPVKPGAPAANGLRGRYAARFEPYGIDAVGNRSVKLEDGSVVRMSPQVYKLLGDARLKGYDAGTKFRTELQKQRDEEKKPGPLGKTLDYLGLR